VSPNDVTSRIRAGFEQARVHIGDVAHIHDGQPRAAARDSGLEEGRDSFARLAELVASRWPQDGTRIGDRHRRALLLQFPDVLLDADLGVGVVVAATAQGKIGVDEFASWVPEHHRARDVDDALDSLGGDLADDVAGALEVRLDHVAGFFCFESHHGGGVHDGLAPVERVGDPAGVGHVTGHGVGGVESQRRGDGRQLHRVTDQQP